jgi:hypothetical protein
MADDELTPVPDLDVIEAVRAAWRALSDLRLEQKDEALRQLQGWLELERRSHLPEDRMN